MSDDLLLRIRAGATAPGPDDAADRPLLLGTMARILPAVAACRLVERRLLSFSTLLSECVPARTRAGAAPDTCLHDLLLDRSAAGDLLLAACLEAVTGEPIARIVDREVTQPLGLRTTCLDPQPTSTAHDLDRLLGSLAGDSLLGEACRGELLDRGYGAARLRRGAVVGYGCDGTGPEGPVLAHHYPALGLTVVARGRPAVHLPDAALADHPTAETMRLA